jgi:hypothetical protein
MSLSVQVADGIYEELDSHDEKLNLGITLTPAMPNDLIASYSTISLPVTSSSSKLIKQEDSTSEENVEVGFELWCYVAQAFHSLHNSCSYHIYFGLINVDFLML